MAQNASKIPFLRLPSNRGGVMANICPRPVGEVANITSNVLDNKVIVAAADGALPITRVAVAFRAGSRYETPNTLGATHMLRIMLGQSTRNSTGFAITRNIQQVGGGLNVTSDREIICYSMETTAIHMETGLRYLQDCLQPAFKPWELEDSLPRLRTQVAAIPPQIQAIELMHKAAFHTGLGNSIYMPEFRIGSLTCEAMQQYVTSHFTANRCAVIGSGLDYNTLSGFAQALDLYNHDVKQETASYYGGDERRDAAGDWAHVAVAGQGGALLNQKEALAFSIIEHAFGGGAGGGASGGRTGGSAVCKRGQIHGSFGEALKTLGDDVPYSFATLNACYAETGLFGFIISTSGEHIGRAVESLSAALKSGTVSEADFKRGKALLQSAVLETYTTDAALLNEAVLQALITKQILSAETLLSTIDNINEGDVQSAARKVGAGKLSVGAVGNLANVPYAVELS